MSWPKRELALSYECEHQDNPGWHIGAGVWNTAGDYANGGDTAYVLEVLRDARTELRQVSIHIMGRRICGYVEPAQAIRILEQFAAELEPQLAAASDAAMAWQPR